MSDGGEASEFTREEWETIKELVYRWETEEPPDLKAWLMAECPSPRIRDEVERLVRASATSGDFLKRRASEEIFGVPALHPVKIGRYQVIEEIGVGGLGVVYSAYDQALERKVAIKVLADQVGADAQHRKRLRWDAKAASATAHPNIVTIYDIGNENGVDYIVMECVEGNPLGKLIHPGGLPSAIVLKYALQIVDALIAAHNCGLVHRDLKPNNVMITPGGTVKILDFGLAKLDNPSLHHTSLPSTIEGHFAGTVAYVAPEQAEGKPVDARADIFSFGCILFEMLAGKQAFEGNTPLSVLGSILHQSTPELRLVAPHVDERFDPIVQRCLRKDANERYGSMLEVRTELEKIVETVKPPRFRARTRRLIRRAAAVAGVAAIVALVILLLKRAQAPPGETYFEQVRVTADNGLASYPTISRDGQTIAYASNRGNGKNLAIWVQNWATANARQITTDEGNADSPAFTPRAEEIIYHSDRGGGGLYQIPLNGGSSMLVARGARDGHYSADGRWLAYWTGELGNALIRGSARIYLMPAQSAKTIGPAEEFPAGFDVAAYPIWSPAEDAILFFGRKTGETKGDWWVAKVADKSVHRTGVMEKVQNTPAKSAKRTIYPVPGVWLPDYTVLFSASQLDANQIYSIHIDPAGTLLDKPRAWSGGTEMEIFPDAAITSGGNIHAVYAALSISNSILRIPLNPAGIQAGEMQALTTLYRAGSPTLSADGKILAFSHKQPSAEAIQLAKLGEALPLHPTVLDFGQSARPVLSGDGKSIAWMSQGNGYLMPVSRGEQKRVCTGCGEPAYLNFDGTKVIFEAGRAQKNEELVLAVPGQNPRPLFHLNDGARWLQAAGRFSPDERWVVFCGWHEGDRRRQILVVPVTPDGNISSSQLVNVTNDDYSNREPVWSPDGERIYFISDRDGPDCVWASNVDSASKHPKGEAFAVAHFHNAGRVVRGPTPYSGAIGLSTAKDFLVLTVTDTKGSIWSRGY